MEEARTEIKEREQLRREQRHKNEEATKRVAEIEAKVQEAEKDRNRLRDECEAARRDLEGLLEVQKA